MGEESEKKKNKCMIFVFFVGHSHCFGGGEKDDGTAFGQAGGRRKGGRKEAESKGGEKKFVCPRTWRKNEILLITEGYMQGSP